MQDQLELFITTKVAYTFLNQPHHQHILDVADYRLQVDSEVAGLSFEKGML